MNYTPSKRPLYSSVNRGVDIKLHAQYKKWKLSPGFGTIFRINTGLNTFQLPLIFSLSINDYFSFYAGPVFTFNDVKLIDSDTEYPFGAVVSVNV